MTMMTQNINALSKETIDELSRRLDPEFQKTKGNLFFQKAAGFLGRLLCTVQFEWSREAPTARICATQLQWNPDWFLTLSKEMRVTVLAHELWHNGLMHGIRLGDRCPDIWNIAGDHVINNLLHEHGYVFEGPHVRDPKYSGWSTDEVYDDLIAGGMKPHQQIQIDLGVFGKDVRYDDPTPNAQDINIASVVGAMTTARMVRGAGDVPGEINKVLDEFLNPKLPWETLLFNFFNALTSQEYSYSRPNRRYEDPILPGITGRNGLEHLVYMVDCSASISDEQALRMNSEVKYIQEELRPERLTLITFDTKIRRIYEYEIEDEFDKVEIVRGGGTSLIDCWRYLEDHRPTAAVVFTDLDVGIPQNPGIPIIWVCVDNPRAEVPYGQLVHFSESQGVRMGVTAPDKFVYSSDHPAVTAG